MSLVRLPTFLTSEFEESDLEQNMDVSFSPSKIDASQLKTSTEQFLYNAWLESQASLKTAEEKNGLLQSSLEQLQKRLETLEKLSNVQSVNTPIKESGTGCSGASARNQDYLTDEEELCRETNWIVQKNKKFKKRKASASPPVSPQSINELRTGRVPEAKVIAPNKSNVVLDKTIIPKRKPPPVILSNVKNYNEFKQILQTQDFNFKTNLMNNEQLKVNVESEQDYRKLTKLMNDNKLDWHTYENKQTRPIRVMARDLHPSCDPEDIKTDLLNKGFKIISVVNRIKKYKTEGKEYITPLPLFMLTFENTENIKKIYDISYICHMKVKIEALKLNKFIPQCKRCQRYGHTQKYCQHEPICVKCAGKHLTSDCRKSQNDPPKCFNCAEAHPANYRGCLIAKELQKRRNNLNKTKDTQKSQVKTVPSKKISNNVSFSDVVKANHSEGEEKSNIMQLLQEILNRLDKCSERLDKLEGKNTILKVKKTK